MTPERLEKIKAMAAERDSVTTPIAFELAEEVARLNLQLKKGAEQIDGLLFAVKEAEEKQQASDLQVGELRKWISLYSECDCETRRKPAQPHWFACRHALGQKMLYPDERPDYQCAARLDKIFCDLAVGHEGLHCKFGQVPETTLHWRLGPPKEETQIEKRNDETPSKRVWKCFKTLEFGECSCCYDWPR